MDKMGFFGHVLVAINQPMQINTRCFVVGAHSVVMQSVC